jgi:hypothetical protein
MGWKERLEADIRPRNAIGLPSQPLRLMVQQSQQDDNRDRNAQQPEKDQIHSDLLLPGVAGLPGAVADRPFQVYGMQTLMTGLAFGESLRWHDDRLWISDWGAREVVAIDLAGKSEVIARAPSFPSCIDFLRDGRLLIVSARDGLLLRREPDGSLVTQLGCSFAHYITAYYGARAACSLLDLVGSKATESFGRCLLMAGSRNYPMCENTVARRTDRMDLPSDCG